MLTRLTLALAVIALVTAAAATRPAEQYAMPMRVADKAPSRAHPFPLGDVRLLDGPFRDAMKRDADYLLSLDADRLLHNFRVTAGLPSSATPLGGWETPETELRGHTVGHYLSALALMYASSGDVRFKDRADLIVRELAKVQDAESAKFHPGYLSAFPEEFIDRVEKRERVWAPYYTLHKIMAGLLDVHLLCGNAQALDVVKKQADWTAWRNERLTEDQRQRMLTTEHGGMTEVLANLYAVTGDEKYLKTAKLFDHLAIIDPLARGVDPLDNVHANTQIPKIIGAAREYEMTGDTRYRDIASFFWQRVVYHRSFVNGGNSDGESFFPEDQFSRHLGAAGPETCNTYNMLKLTRHLFAWDPTAETMDYYERALLNHILASQDPKTGMVLYYCPLKPGAFKTYSTENDSFWCCVGTGMENHVKYNDTIYFHDDSSLFVNLFIPSELTWKEKELKVRQETRFPESDTTTLTFTAARPVRLPVRIRYPGWASHGMKLSVNGRPDTGEREPGSYVTIDRTWKTGDVVQVQLPMSLHEVALPGTTNVMAMMYGPVVLAGDLGTAGLDGVRRYGPSAPPVGRLSPIDVPAFVTAKPTDLREKIQPVAGQPLTFRTVGLAQPHDVTLIPYYKTFDPRYTMYWNVYSADEWDRHKTDVAADAARHRSIEARTIDVVDVSSDASETAHAMKVETPNPQAANTGFTAGRRWRSVGAGALSYDLAVAPDKPVALLCTFPGSGGRRRAFDVFVDGQKIASDTLEYHPTELLDREYAIPEALTKGKSKITVRFQPQPNASTGGVVEVRTFRP
jgi:DUF1680 family protein